MPENNSTQAHQDINIITINDVIAALQADPLLQQTVINRVLTMRLQAAEAQVTLLESGTNSPT